MPSETISGDTRPDLEATDSADAASVIEISDQIEIPDVRVATPRAVALPRPAAPDGLESTPRGWRGTLSRIPLSHPALMKYGAPSLLLAMIGVGAIKFWPSGATELPGATPPTTSLASLPTTDETASADFEFKGEPSTKAQPSTKPQPITPAPESQFRPSSILNPDSIGSFLSDATGADADVEPKAEPAAALGAEIQDKPEPDAPNSAADDARAALEQALAAESVTELAKLVLTPERVLPKMKLYYGGRSPALVGTSIIYETSMPLPDSEHLNHTFFVSTEQQPMRFPIAIEETPDGMKLDWESFIELHDDLLGKFIASPQSDERTFHLILERRHFFGSDVPELGSKDCFRISTPIPGSEAYAFVEKDTPTAAVCKPFEWDRLCFPIATLRWTTPPAGKPYLEITKIVQTSWRAGGDAGAPELQ